MELFSNPLVLIVVAAIVFFVLISAIVARYKRCPSDKILVIYGKTGGASARCVHGGMLLFGLLFRILHTWT